jgi:hypothetical protein
MGEFTASAVNGKIYVIGGCNNKGTDFTNVLEYDPVKDTYTQKTSLPVIGKGNWRGGRGGWQMLSACVINNLIYVFGGYVVYPEGNYVGVYDPATDSWTRMADMPTGRISLAASAVKRKIYAIGGSVPGSDVIRGDGIPLATVEEYDTGFMSEAVATKVRLPKNWGEIKTKD